MFPFLVDIDHFVHAMDRVDLPDITESGISGMLALLVSFCILVVGVYFLISTQPRLIARWVVSTIFVIFLIGAGVYYASDFFTGDGFDEKVIYHLNVGLEGAGFGEYLPLILAMTAFAVASSFAGYFVFDLLGLRDRKLSQTIVKHRFEGTNAARKDLPDEAEPDAQTTFIEHQRAATALGALAISAAFLLNPITRNIADVVFVDRLDLTDIVNADIYTQPGAVLLTRRKNIVYIYLEGLERTFLDEEAFPGLMPNLKRLESRAISFTDVRAVHGTGFTIAGIVGSQCGTPLYTSPSASNTMNSYDDFLPNAHCLGDILKDNGYALEFLGGADLRFGGKGKFLRGHGFDRIIGKEFFKENLPPDTPFSPWGLYDDILYEESFKRFEALSAGNEPFGLFLLNLDTHPPRGFLSKECADTEYGDGSSQLLNIIHCTDKLTNAFIQRLQGTPQAKDTIFVVASDHIGLRSTLTPALRNLRRRNLLFIIDPDQSPRLIERPSSVLDIAPTLLTLLGGSVPKFGFGRDLLGPSPTLFESKPGEFNSLLISLAGSLKKALWGYPTLQAGFGLVETRGDTLNESADAPLLAIGQRRLGLPLILELDDMFEISEVLFDHPNPRLRKGFLQTKLSKEMNLIWIDFCSNISVFTLDEDTAEEDTYCIMSDPRGEAPPQTLPLKIGRKLSLKDVFPKAGSSGL